MRRFLVLGAMMIAAVLAGSAQTTTVSATVTDSDTVAWAGGSYTITYQSSTNLGGPLTNIATGAVLTQRTVTGTLDNTGSFSVSLISSAFLQNPEGHQSPGVTITVCPAVTGAQCQTTPMILISGTAQSVSSNLSAVVIAPRVAADYSGKVLAYADVEVSGTAGTRYFRTSDQTFRCYASGAWSSCSNSVAITTNYFPSPNLGTAYNSSGMSATANATKLWDFMPTTNVSANKITYVIANPDNTASHHYDFGIFNYATGLRVCDVGATAGTTFAPTVGTITLNWASTCNLTAGTRYVIALTGDNATAQIYGSGSCSNPQEGQSPSAGGTTSGGQLPASLTVGADAWGSGSCIIYQLHN